MSLHINLRELEVFCAIAAHEHVSRAAHDVALTQSAASQALGRLERALNVQLFDRHERRLILNEHGRLLLPRARALLEDAQELETLFTGQALSLNIGASTTIANYLLPPLLARFRNIYPHAGLEIEVGNTQNIVDAVAAFEVDFGLIEGPCHHVDLIPEPWLEDELVIFAPSHHPLAHRPLSNKALAQAPWLLREQGSGTREEVERLLYPHLGHLNLNVELGDSEAIKHSVAAGLGISCLSRRVVADLLNQGSIVEVRSNLPTLSRTLYRVHHKARQWNRGMATFMEISKD